MTDAALLDNVWVPVNARLQILRARVVLFLMSRSKIAQLPKALRLVCSLNDTIFCGRGSFATHPPKVWYAPDTSEVPMEELQIAIESTWLVEDTVILDLPMLRFLLKQAPSQPVVFFSEHKQSTVHDQAWWPV